MIKSGFKIHNLELFKQKALQFAVEHYKYVCMLENCGVDYLYDPFPNVLAFSNKTALIPEKNSFESLQKLHSNASRNLYGFLSYDLKNEIEELETKHTDFITFPNLCFFEPEIELFFEENQISIISNISPIVVLDAINHFEIKKSVEQPTIEVESVFTKENYIKTVNLIKDEILKGNIYELNFCMEFQGSAVGLQPVASFFELLAFSPMPFSAFFKQKDNYLICASPERFLKKKKDTLISQPIKGTTRRGRTEAEDAILKNNLAVSEKEIAENVMIVDLVRNDLTLSAADGSVKAEELCKIYSFKQVHQMISTVTAKVKPEIELAAILKNTFPMGSMTGAPKMRAMELIDVYEKSKRGLFSGSVGYITPKGDFDFNVVIRSILYNQTTQKLSFQVGSAITADADPAKEWDECWVKSQAIRKLLKIE
jgi:para-aminobenzoate synthetase component I